MFSSGSAIGKVRARQPLALLLLALYIFMCSGAASAEASADATAKSGKAEAKASADCARHREGDVVSVLCEEGGVYAAASLTGGDYEGDENGDGFTTTYVSSNFHGAWGDLTDTYNRQQNNHFPDEPRIKRVYEKSRAELWVHREDTRRGGCAGMTFNRALVGPKDLLDEIIVDSDCSNPAPYRLLLHEFGHNEGLRHVDCTSYFKERSVMVAQLDEAGKVIGGCTVQLDLYGERDVAILERWDPNGI